MKRLPNRQENPWKRSINPTIHFCMCGFAGIYAPSFSSSVLEPTVRRMTVALAHRGPDGEGVYVREGIALGHRRLSILDLTERGAQPMSLGLQGPTIAFNGEIYNFLDLRRELEGLGRSFKSHSDTEVLLQTYAEWGMVGLRRLEGIFAFGLWDPSKQRLILMRDRFGVKPLFFSHSGARILFGSEIKALVAAGEFDSTLDEQALSEYLWYGNAYEDRTIYRSVRALLPGHWLIVEPGKFQLEPWWRLEEWLEEASFIGEQQEATKVVRDSLAASVKRQLVADVPVGIFLSGGIDSTAIAEAAVQVHSKTLDSFSVGFDFDEGINELPKARRVAEHLGLNHHEIQIKGADLEEVLIKLVRAHDEPFADAANIPLFLLAQQVGGKMKVVLQGDGGDEMFAGYRRYAILQNMAFWRIWPQPLTPMIRTLFGHIGKRLARIVMATGAESPAMRMALLLTTETLYDPPTSLLNVDAQNHLAATTDPFLGYRRCAQRFKEFSPVQQMLLTDISLQLPSQFLTKVDRATMACGLEARVPLLDEILASFAVPLPSEWKVCGRQKKIILRNAIRSWVPDDILDSPKTGFGVPYEYWLKGALYPFVCDTIFHSGFLDRFGFDRSKIEKAYKEHRQGTRDRGFTLWKIFQLALWSRECPHT